MGTNRTFGPKAISSITLLPRISDETAGRFRVWLWLSEEGKETTTNDVAEPQQPESKPILVWDRKSEGGFPELKVLVSQPQNPLVMKYSLAIRNNASEIMFSPDNL
jgi:hypothetical protein